MLTSLSIRNIALIEKMEVHFHTGMQVLTGETGAGKSIVVDAVNLAIGGRSDRNLIRSGAEKASVEAVFDAPGNDRIREIMNRESIDYDGRTVILFREIAENGRNIARVCGVAVTVALLREISECLMNVHGQNDQQFLTSQDMQLNWLDQTGGPAHRELLERTRSDYNGFIRNHREYAALVKKSNHREERLSELEEEISFLEKADFQPDEEEKLKNEILELKTAGEKIGILRNATQALLGNDDMQGALSLLKETCDLIRNLSNGDQRMKEILEKCDHAYFDIEEAAFEISRECDRYPADPGLLDSYTARLEMIREYREKYHCDLPHAVIRLDQLKDEYRELKDLDGKLEEMSKEHKQLLAAYRNTARLLTESRKRLAVQLKERLEKELAELGMSDTVFEVAFLNRNTGKPVMPTEIGDDQIEFMITANRGEPLKPLGSVASGGELSRIMLAMKTIEMHQDGIEAMVFDEIDTGISGRTAQAVAEKMIRISQTAQVICVTHLPQIAAAADYHFLIQKAVSCDRMLTSVTELTAEERILALAKMISGADGISDGSVKYAGQLLSSASAVRRKNESQPVQ